MIFFAVKTRREMNAAFKASRVQVGEVNANVETAIAGMRVSRSYTADEHENAKFGVANENFKKARSRAYRAMATFGSGMNFFNDMLYLLVLTAGGLFFYYGKIDSGDFVAFLLYVSIFMKPINRLVSLFEQLQEGMTGFQRFTEIMDESEEKDEGKLNPDKLEGNIVFDDVSFRYSNSDSRRYRIKGDIAPFHAHRQGQDRCAGWSLRRRKDHAVQPYTAIL